MDGFEVTTPSKSRQFALRRLDWIGSNCDGLRSPAPRERSQEPAPVRPIHLHLRHRFHSRFRWVGSFVSHPCSLGTQDAAADDAARIPFAEPGQASKGKKRVLSPLTRKNFCAQVDSPSPRLGWAVFSPLSCHHSARCRGCSPGPLVWRSIHPSIIQRHLPVGWVGSWTGPPVVPRS